MAKSRSSSGSHRTRSAPVIALDGPSGAGKGAVGQRLAIRLGWHFLDSGALYRVAALAAQQAGCDFRDIGGLVALASGVNVRFEPQVGSDARVLLDDRDIGDVIRTEEIGRLASEVAVLSAVRQALLKQQQTLRQPPGLVADGRDMGTVVFPDAELKIFLTASPVERAERRYNQLKDKGFDVNLARLAEEIRVRDARDEEREVSPLKPADDAYIIDSSDLSIAQVVERVLGLLQKQQGP
ncbi:MAG: (d)CMP kinase [Acidiferrobacterales bacterium]